MTLRENLMQATMEVFNEKGLKFTMDDLAEKCGISKKTIYQVFESKEALFLCMVDYIFDGIKEEEQAILQNNTLELGEKIRKVLGAMPGGYQKVDFSRLHELKKKYPRIYRQVEKRLETGWENTLTLLQQGMEAGVIRQVHLSIFQLMFEAALEQFFQRDILQKNHLRYDAALQEVVDILMNGISIEKRGDI